MGRLKVIGTKLLYGKIGSGHLIVCPGRKRRVNATRCRNAKGVPGKTANEKLQEPGPMKQDCSRRDAQGEVNVRPLFTWAHELVFFSGGRIFQVAVRMMGPAVKSQPDRICMDVLNTARICFLNGDE